MEAHGRWCERFYARPFDQAGMDEMRAMQRLRTCSTTRRYEAYRDVSLKLKFVGAENKEAGDPADHIFRAAGDRGAERDLSSCRLDAGGVKIGDKCYHFKIIYYDDESTPARAAQLIERLINQDKVKFVLGPYSSPMTKAVLPITEKYKTPVVQAEAASRSLFTQGYKYHFGIVATSEKYLTPVIDMAAEHAKKGRRPGQGQSGHDLSGRPVFPRCSARRA
jgi:hypothetical protein